MIAHNARLLRVFLPETTLVGERPAWQEVLALLRTAGFAGATAYRGRAGYSGRRMVTSRIEVMATGFPMVIEAVESPERIDGVLARVEDLVTDRGLVTVEAVEARTYSEGRLIAE